MSATSDGVTRLVDVIDPSELGAALRAGYVRAQEHPTEPLVIYNYTAKTQFERAWNDVTRRCRGLIVNYETGRVVARPFEKFFNYDELAPDTLDADANVTVTDKADGSLGILYPVPSGGWAVATRGSFTSEQAVQATKMLRVRYADWLPPAVERGITVLFEIIYPANRVVLDYGDRRELRLIDALWIDRGWPLGSDPEVVTRAIGWTGPRVAHLGTVKLKTALAQLVAPRVNAEGVVLRFLDTDRRIKLKQADYVALHRVLTRTSARTIWECLAVNACRDVIDPAKPKHWGSRLGIAPQRAAQVLSLGSDWRERLLENTPDEFHRWVSDVMNRLYLEVRELRHWVEHRTEELVDVSTVNGEFQRPLFFNLVRRVDPERWGLLARHLDEQDYTTDLWKHVRPSGTEVPFRAVAEDAE